jgi:uncharacterized membrane protein (DUF441 family)
LTPAQRLERAFVVLVATHSVAVGVGLAAVPAFATGFAGFPPVSPAFFARQAGAFHLALAAGYLVEHLRYRGVAFLVAAKAIATVFLLAATLAGGVPWSVPFSAAADAAMGALAFWLHRRATGG